MQRTEFLKQTTMQRAKSHDLQNEIMGLAMNNHLQLKEFEVPRKVRNKMHI